VTSRDEELWAAACIEAALPGVASRRHDDGSRPSMHDIDLFRGADRFGACEVTAAADGESLALWKLVNGGDDRWIEEGLEGGWMLTLDPSCRAKKLKAGLRAFWKRWSRRAFEKLGAGARMADPDPLIHG
jgi:hypothetical protein